MEAVPRLQCSLRHFSVRGCASPEISAVTIRVRAPMVPPSALTAAEPWPQLLASSVRKRLPSEARRCRTVVERVGIVQGSDLASARGSWMHVGACGLGTVVFCAGTAHTELPCTAVDVSQPSSPALRASLGHELPTSSKVGFSTPCPETSEWTIKRPGLLLELPSKHGAAEAGQEACLC